MGNNGIQIDKRIPITVIGVIVFQSLLFVWWIASYTAAKDAMDARQNDDIRDLKTTASSLSDLKSDVAVIKSKVGDITDKLDKIK